MTRHGCVSKATTTGLFLTCAVAVLLPAGPAPAEELVLRGGVRRSGGVVLNRRDEPTVPAARDDPGGLSWVSQDATYEASSSYVRDDGTVLRPLPSLLTGRGRLYRPVGGEDCFAFHTNEEKHPHIIITLTGVPTIQRLFIENRRGVGAGELGRASGLTVWVSGDKKSWKRVWTAEGVAPSWMVKLKAPVAAAYVKIGLPHTDYLHLTTVKIYGRSGGIPPVTRLARADRVELNNGNLLLGTIVNKSYVVTTFYGRIEVPARRVVGIVPARDKPTRVSLVQTDGQVIVGTMADQTVRLTLPAGSTLNVPPASIRQFGYRISKDRPAVFPASQHMVLLSSGDRLIWTECRPRLQLVGAWGAVDLQPRSLRRIEPIDKAGRSHRARFHGGSVLAGTLRPDKFTLKLKVAGELGIASKDVRLIACPTKPPAPSGKSEPTATVLLHDGSRLLGRLEHETLALRTTLGQAKVYAGDLRTMTWDAKRAGVVTVETWDGMTLIGQLVEGKLACRITAGGPRVSLNAAQVASVTQSAPLLRPEVRKKAEKLIAQLGAESYKDREAATKELVKTGKGIVPLLKKHAESPDAEVRQRIVQILAQLGFERSDN